MEEGRDMPDERVLYCFTEPEIQTSRRVLCIAAVWAVLMGLVWWFFGNSQIGTFFVCLLLVAVVLFIKKHGTGKKLVIRPDDFFTLGGDLDQLVAWDWLESATNDSSKIVLGYGNGASKQVSLPFLNPEDRATAIATVIRMIEIRNLHGLMILPGAGEIELKTHRLILRCLSSSDRKAFLSISMHPSIRSQQLSVNYSMETESEMFDHRIESQKNYPGIWDLAVSKGNTVVGFIHLWMKDFILREAVLGLNIDPAYHNQGYATEALSAVMDFIRDETGLVKVSAACFSANIACRRVLEKAGMKHSGLESKKWVVNGEWQNADHFEWVRDPESEK